MKPYIVTFTEKIESASDVVEILSRVNVVRRELVQSARTEYEADSNFKYLDSFGLALMHLSDNEIEALMGLAEIVSIEEDSKVGVLGELEHAGPQILHPPGARWNMNMVKADTVWPTGSFGESIRVAVIDTGIAWHPNLQTYGGKSFVTGISSYRDDNGHGTHCAGIIAGKGKNNVFGVAPGAELYSVKVLDLNGDGFTSWVLSGMDWCVTAGMNVVNMSLGGTRAPQAAYARAVKKCQERNIVVVCAAGNSHNSLFPWVNSPANSFVAGNELSSPIAVASINTSKTVASSSSRGGNSDDWNQVTIAAPGVSIFSTYLNSGYATLSGTSMACPHVAGLAALILEDSENIIPLLVKALITTSAEQLGATPIPNEPYGHGLIDCANALGIITSRMEIVTAAS